jgi:hypothetical protein
MQAYSILGPIGAAQQGVYAAAAVLVPESPGSVGRAPCENEQAARGLALVGIRGHPAQTDITPVLKHRPGYFRRSGSRRSDGPS